jgi:hypothetical protein
VIKPDGKRQELEVETKIVEGKGTMNAGDFVDLAEKEEKEDFRNNHRFYEAGEDLLIWKMRRFDLEPEKVDGMIGRAKKHRALILDLRGNGGGREVTLLRMIGNLFDRDIKVGDIKRRNETKPLGAKTRGNNTFSGKLIVLIDSKSGSASEVLARTVLILTNMEWAR